MKKTILSIAVGACVFGQATLANAIILTPPDSDLFDFDHTKAYAWGFKYTLGEKETISSAKLTIKGIYNWQVETNSLKLTLMNTPPRYTSQATGNASNYIVTKTDGEYYEDYWETYKRRSTEKNWDGWEKMARWSDVDGPKTANTLVYDFKDLYVYNEAGTILLDKIAGGEASLGTLQDYLADGIVGIGFDPDCHYYNTGVQLELTTYQTTSSVPAPAAALPFALGLFARARRRKA